jgi:hypothetical protein
MYMVGNGETAEVLPAEPVAVAGLCPGELLRRAEERRRGAASA